MRGCNVLFATSGTRLHAFDKSVNALSTALHEHPCNTSGVSARFVGFVWAQYLLFPFLHAAAPSKRPPRFDCGVAPKSHVRSWRLVDSTWRIRISRRRSGSTRATARTHALLVLSMRTMYSSADNPSFELSLLQQLLCSHPIQTSKVLLSPLAFDFSSVASTGALL